MRGSIKCCFPGLALASYYYPRPSKRCFLIDKNHRKNTPTGGCWTTKRPPRMPKHGMASGRHGMVFQRSGVSGGSCLGGFFDGFFGLFGFEI